MNLKPGTRLVHYEIDAAIGKGGMGEVYRAQDTRLHREVAVKVSDARFSERFEREARAVASLNHPNICTLYDVGSAPEAPGFLVMEYIDGPTLADRLKDGPLPLDEALHIARQVVAALAAAHAKGIVHRDLKPGNIKIKDGGVVKVLDFGLAKIGAGATVDADQSPTLTMTMTEAGVVLGTAGYMPPEQARGKTVDKRADIWAFGVVLYEMLAGARLFKGETVTDTLAAVIERQPDLAQVPERVRPLLRACLQKDPNQRLHDISDAFLLLDTAPAASTAVAPVKRGWLWPALAGAALLAAAAVSVLHFRESPPQSPLARFEMTLAANSNPVATYLALSPDGRYLAFTATEPDGVIRVWVRSMDTLQAHQIPGTEGGLSPFWSPDSRWLGFAVGGKLEKVEIGTSAPPVVLAEVQGNAGIGAWNQDGTIVFGNRVSGGGLMRIAASGGTPVKLTSLLPSQQESSHSFPVFMPDGKHFIYLRLRPDNSQTGIYAGSTAMKPEDPPGEMLVSTPFGATYVPSATAEGGGWLVFLRSSTLMAQPFDASTMKLLGEPAPIADGVGAGGSAGYFSTSSTGTLVYRSGGTAQRQLSWYDRKGALLGRLGGLGAYLHLSISPDGNRVAVVREDGQNDIWVLDATRDTSTRFTFDPSLDLCPLWSPDGSQIAYCSGNTGQNLMMKAANNAGQPRQLLKDESSRALIPMDFTRDGKYLLFRKADKGADLYAVDLNPQGGELKPFPVVNTPFNETQGKLSPDGRWVAYRSNESGAQEIYVRPFQPGGSEGAGQWMVSTNGGHQPRWSRDGKQLYYFGLPSTLMVVDVSSNGAGFLAGVPRKLFDAPVYPTLAGDAVPSWDMTPDGMKFLMATGMVSAITPPTTVVLNWESGLRR